MTARSALLDLPGPVLAELTPRLVATYVFLVDFIGQTGYPPSIRQIGEHTGLASTSSVYADLRRLERLGLIRREREQARAITVVEWDGAAA
jgi:repressor LexA